jgi:hypothetical protein
MRVFVCTHSCLITFIPFMAVKLCMSGIFASKRKVPVEIHCENHRGRDDMGQVSVDKKIT